ncbi:hypothetical protein BX661DRAFT_182224 [Kickxella alabastrina]|uniref:uncharacterized protein n=1 Tax=Kickxella alabastrina TaxID=61397 RepID=UPI00221F6295|nr:uncharacterized protein BX661DRAFT_182220 [Kickxella alabastrina]XP_051392038.1 uncharacterized protein BX661DRAFT_182224 [Kickxella alabastrina]KAI7828510.1 hypothetical protein BX661DRAFT_182220 [Kickxella alabastrina]KAI7828514.1 hypothetical protein BX661DRAFT_182224 [Kickxella alabastrina]
MITKLASTIGKTCILLSLAPTLVVICGVGWALTPKAEAEANVAANPAFNQNKTTNTSSASHTNETKARVGFIEMEPAQAHVAAEQALTKAQANNAPVHAAQRSEGESEGKGESESESLRRKLAVFESKLAERDASIADLKVKLGRAEKDNAALQIKLASTESMLRVQRQNVKSLDADVRKAERELKEARTSAEEQQQLVVELRNKVELSRTVQAKALQHGKPVFCSGSLHVQRQNVRTMYDEVCKAESELNAACAVTEAQHELIIKLCNEVKAVQARAKAQQPAGKPPRAGYFGAICTPLAKVAGISHASKPDIAGPSATFLALKEIADSLDEIFHRGGRAQTNQI